MSKTVWRVFNVASKSNSNMIFRKIWPSRWRIQESVCLSRKYANRKCWRQRISVNINVIKKSRASQSYRWANFRKIKHHLPFLIFGSWVFYLKTIINSVINFYFCTYFQAKYLKWSGWSILGGAVAKSNFWFFEAEIRTSGLDFSVTAVS